MSERNRYRVQVTREGIVYADNPIEAEEFGIEEEHLWPVVMVDVDSVAPRDPVGSMATAASSTNEVTQGTRVQFEHGDAIRHGIVNGDPFIVLHGWRNAQAYVPVHVPDGNKNVIVHIGNLVALDGD